VAFTWGGQSINLKIPMIPTLIVTTNKTVASFHITNCLVTVVFRATNKQYILETVYSGKWCTKNKLTDSFLSAYLSLQKLNMQNNLEVFHKYFWEI
jgi:hypothetical protein